MSPGVTYFRPDCLGECLAFLREHGGQCRFIAGGTDVVPELRSGAIRDKCLVDISGIAEVKGIEETDDTLAIGSGVTLSEICDSRSVARWAPCLSEAAATFASRQIRNVATIGGNICRASPAGDTLPPLVALDAQLELVSASSERGVSMSEFILGPGHTALGPDEVLRCIRLKKERPFSVSSFEKVGTRKVLAVSVVSLAALVSLNDAGVVEGVRLAWGSVAPTVVRSMDVEEFLTGKSLNSQTLEKAFPLVQQAISPIDDLRASAAYRRRAAAGLLFRLMENRQATG